MPEQYLIGYDYLSKMYDFISPSQIKNEIDYFMNFYNDITPSMNIFYDRLAFYDRSNPDIRFTFDSNIICRNYDFDLKNGIYGEKILNDDMHLLEIKIAGALPLWVTEMLDEFKIYPTTFSKYGTAYQKLIVENKNDINTKIIKFNGGIHCA